MSFSKNTAILIGRLGQDPESSYLPGGDLVVRLSLATSKKWKDKSGGQKEKTEWHQISCWGKLGESALQYLRKGDRVFVEGEIQYRKYEKNGVDHWGVSIVASQAFSLSDKKSDEGEERTSAQNASHQSSPPPDNSSFGGQNYSGNPSQRPPQGPTQKDMYEPGQFTADDIPF